MRMQATSHSIPKIDVTLAHLQLDLVYDRFRIWLDALDTRQEAYEALSHDDRDRAEKLYDLAQDTTLRRGGPV